MKLHELKLSKLQGTRRHNKFIRVMYDFMSNYEVIDTREGAHLIVFGANVWEVKLTTRGFVSDIYLFGTLSQAVRTFGPNLY